MGKFGTTNINVNNQSNINANVQKDNSLSNHNNNNDRSLFENSFNKSGNIMTIASLNSNINTWKFKAKIESKSVPKTWTKGDKTFTNFFVIFSDSRGAKIEGTFWAEAVQKFHPFLEEGSVYEVSNGQLRPQQRQWAKTDHN